MPNLTIRIDDDELIRAARILAAKRGTSISALVRDHLRGLVARELQYERSMVAALRTMEEGLDLGGPLDRETIYHR